MSGFDTPDTRRVVLSAVSSLRSSGSAAPVTIQRKLLLLEITDASHEWDEPLSENFIVRWQAWKPSLESLDALEVPRSHTRNSAPVTKRELHIFADASEKAIAAVVFLRTCSSSGIDISIVLGKAKVAKDFLRSDPNFTGMAVNMDYPLEEEDKVRPEITVLATEVMDNTLGSDRFSRFSSWTSLVRAITTLIHFATFAKAEPKSTGKNIERAKGLVIRGSQLEFFSEELAALKNGSEVRRTSILAKLNLFLDPEGLRIGCRLNSSKLDLREKHPVIIHRSSHIAILLVRHYHKEVMHQGRHFTEGAIRSAGYWIIGGKRLVSSITHQCVICRKLRVKQTVQKMADLPSDRLDPDPLFTQVGIDTFGPWPSVIRRTRGGQANNKRWDTLFTCLTTGAVHIEVVEELSSSSCINAIRRLYSVRWPSKIFRSDCGTNFIGCSKEHDLLDGAEWILNPPHASDMGGV